MILVLLLVLLAPLPMAAEEPSIVAETHEADRRFALASELYTEGDYAAAAATYASVLELGWVSGALHHNLGQAYLGAGNLGLAVLHLQKAALLLPDETAVTTHLAQARAQVGAETVALPASSLAGTAVRVTDVVPLGVVLVLGMLVWMGIVAVLGWWLWRGAAVSPAHQTRIRRGLLVALPLAIVLLAVAALASAERHAPRAVVLDTVPLALTPGGTAEGAAVPEGVTVRLAEARGRWQAVRLPDGTEGWLPVSTLGQL